MSHTATLFDSERLTLGESIALTVDSLRVHGADHAHWAIAYSGGKDSTTLVTLVPHLIRMGLVPAPKRLTVLYADTRMELPPLATSAATMLARLAADGIETRVVRAALDKRFLVYMIGRGVPPPNNSTFRWCTRQIKVDPMHQELARLREGSPGVLMLTGVRLGESAARDARLAISCGKNGAECGQGWYQAMTGDGIATLAPILHWRTCLVWDWLQGNLDAEWRHGYPTGLVADAYGLDSEGSDAEKGARTGCNGCPLATVDTALDGLLRRDRWAYLAPLKRLRPVFRRLREPDMRLRKPGAERMADGRSKPTNRLGPLTLDARRWALEAVLTIQHECNFGAMAGDPLVDMLDREEIDRIIHLISVNTWPDRWAGDEPRGDEPFERIFADGQVQRNMIYFNGDES